jgi:hypothetical protein
MSASKFLISFSRLFCNKFIFFETILYPSLDHRWNKLNIFIQEERTEARKNEELLQSRNESMNKAIESNNAGEVFKTVEQDRLFCNKFIFFETILYPSLNCIILC